jgi:hypothetical protein
MSLPVWIATIAGRGGLETRMQESPRPRSAVAAFHVYSTTNRGLLLHARFRIEDRREQVADQVGQPDPIPGLLRQAAAARGG